MAISRALKTLAQSLTGSQAHDAAVYLLSNVPGLPPIVQTFHILGIAAVMGSVVMIDLRVLGLGLRSQRIDELFGRLMPWTWWALLVLLLSGAVFVLARPARYFSNPVFGLKFALLLPAVLAAGLLQVLNRKHPGLWQQPSNWRAAAQSMAACRCCSGSVSSSQDVGLRTPTICFQRSERCRCRTSGARSNRCRSRRISVRRGGFHCSNRCTC